MMEDETMMLSEFIERTGFEPMADEYAEIEEAYYGFDGDKNAFCKHWLETVGVEGICKARAEKIKQLRATMLDIEKSMMADNAEMKKQIAKLEAELEKEQEWKPYEDKHNCSDAKYDQLANSDVADEMTDDEAADMIAKEFGFVRESISIVRWVPVYEINRHNWLRQIGQKSRQPRFAAWDWNYIRFNVTANVARAYEMVDGNLIPFVN